MSTLKTTNIAHPSSASNNIVLDSSGNATLATAKITTLADSAGSNTSTPAEIASGRAKAWVNFNGTGTVAIRGSYNVSSITDNGTGDYTVNFTTAMPDANYSATSTCMRNFSGVADPVIAVISNSTTYSDSYSTSSLRLKTIFYNASGQDPLAVNVAIFR